jgi:hypothetical protein
MRMAGPRQPGYNYADEFESSTDWSAPSPQYESANRDALVSLPNWHTEVLVSRTAGYSAPPSAVGMPT